MSRYFGTFNQTALRTPKAPPSPASQNGAGRAAVAPAPTERTARWPDPTPHRSGGFNRATKVPVGTPYAAEGGGA